MSREMARNKSKQRNMGACFIGYKAMSSLQSQKNNYCFILSNSIFKYGKTENLEGYKKDIGIIKETFQPLGFKIEVAENKKAYEMEKIFDTWSKYDFSNSDCVVVFILSHGYDNGTIYGVDYKIIKINKIKAMFNSCKELDEKAKLIFLQTCRGNQEPEVEIDIVPAGPGLKERKHFLDTFLHCSTSEGFQSYVRPCGAPFIKTVCDVIQEHVGQYSLTDLTTIINKKVSEHVMQLHDGTRVAQCPEVLHTLRGNVYLTENISPVKSNDADLVKYYIQKKNPCVMLTSSTCKTHKSECENFSPMKKCITDTFSSLNFKIDQSIENKKVNDIKSEIQLLKQNDFSGNDCAAFVVLSCGNMRDENRRVMYGKDGKFLGIDYLISSVNENKTLLGTPKIFFIILNKCDKMQFKGCEGADCMKASNDSQAKYANNFVYHVTVESKEECTHVVTTLCNIMSDFASKGCNLDDMILHINKLVCQMDIIPEVSSSLTYQVFFKHAKSRCHGDFTGVRGSETLTVDNQIKKASPGSSPAIAVFKDESANKRKRKKSENSECTSASEWSERKRKRKKRSRKSSIAPVVPPVRDNCSKKKKKKKKRKSVGGKSTVISVYKDESPNNKKRKKSVNERSTSSSSTVISVYKDEPPNNKKRKKSVSERSTSSSSTISDVKLSVLSSSDEKYQPHAEKEEPISDEEVSTLSETCSPYLPNAPIRRKTRVLYETLSESDNSFTSTPNSISEQSAITPNTKLSSKDKRALIASRTRSRYPMPGVELEEIAASFQPPDCTPDSTVLQNNPDEIAYEEWKCKTYYTSDDDPNDEDFNYMQEVDEEDAELTTAEQIVLEKIVKRNVGKEVLLNSTTNANVYRVILTPVKYKYVREGSLPTVSSHEVIDPSLLTSNSSSEQSLSDDVEVTTVKKARRKIEFLETRVKMKTSRPPLKRLWSPSIRDKTTTSNKDGPLVQGTKDEVKLKKGEISTRKLKDGPLVQGTKDEVEVKKEKVSTRKRRGDKVKGSSTKKRRPKSETTMPNGNSGNINRKTLR